MASLSGDRDQELIAAVRGGNRSAWDSLIRQNERWVRGVVFSTTGNPRIVDDVCQQVWAHAWQQFDTLAHDDKWKAWLYRLARNAAIDAGERAGRQRQLYGGSVEHAVVADRGPTPDQALQLQERHRRVLSAIQALPALYREPFVLRHLEDWSYEQIAETLALPVDTVETRLVRARRMLRESLNGEPV
ncbi:MAG: RNA polymerase sigma factor [Phycisphaerae bacterium]|nr:RNA polymerase sigma factor [Phycisphaerae bacterium]NUQ47701.1 RNA polymerase sigma factor [Phycisphaerae bacterium]